MTLKELKIGNIATIQKIVDDKTPTGKGFKNRLKAMGMVVGKPIQVMHKTWFGGPLVVRVGSTTEIAIRLSEAELVIVKPL